MMARIHPLLAFALLLSSAGALRVPMRAGRLVCAAPAGTKQLYSKIDTVLRRARKNEASNRLAGSIARSLGNRWLEMAPTDLVEATLVSGNVVLDGFDEALDILIEAEEVAELNVTAKAYSALMRLAQAEDRSEEVLALLARTRAFGVDASDGLLVGGMRAAAELEDWGAVARLYAELTEGPEAAARAAVELETRSNDPKVLDELRKESSEGVEARPIDAPPTPNELAQALTLALRAHCERGDVTRVVALVEKKRRRKAPLSTDEYGQLLRLAQRTGTPSPLLALKPTDLKRSLDDAVEPKVWEFVNTVGVLGSALGRVERGLVAGVMGAVVLSSIVLLTGGFDAAGPSYSTSVFADLPAGF